MSEEMQNRPPLAEENKPRFSRKLWLSIAGTLVVLVAVVFSLMQGPGASLGSETQPPALSSGSTVFQGAAITDRGLYKWEEIDVDLFEELPCEATDYQYDVEPIEMPAQVNYYYSPVDLTVGGIIDNIEPIEDNQMLLAFYSPGETRLDLEAGYYTYPEGFFKYEDNNGDIIGTPVMNLAQRIPAYRPFAIILQEETRGCFKAATDRPDKVQAPLAADVAGWSLLAVNTCRDLDAFSSRIDLYFAQTARNSFEKVERGDLSSSCRSGDYHLAWVKLSRQGETSSVALERVPDRGTVEYDELLEYMIDELGYDREAAQRVIERVRSGQRVVIADGLSAQRAQDIEDALASRGSRGSTTTQAPPSSSPDTYNVVISDVPDTRDPNYNDFIAEVMRASGLSRDEVEDLIDAVRRGDTATIGVGLSRDDADELARRLDRLGSTAVIGSGRSTDTVGVNPATNPGTAIRTYNVVLDGIPQDPARLSTLIADNAGGNRALAEEILKDVLREGDEIIIEINESQADAVGFLDQVIALGGSGYISEYQSGDRVGDVVVQGPGSGSGGQQTGGGGNTSLTLAEDLIENLGVSPATSSYAIGFGVNDAVSYRTKVMTPGQIELALGTQNITEAAVTQSYGSLRNVVSSDNGSTTSSRQVRSNWDGLDANRSPAPGGTYYLVAWAATTDKRFDVDITTFVVTPGFSPLPPPQGTTYDEQLLNRINWGARGLNTAEINPQTSPVINLNGLLSENAGTYDLAIFRSSDLFSQVGVLTDENTSNRYNQITATPLYSSSGVFARGSSNRLEFSQDVNLAGNGIAAGDYLAVVRADSGATYDIDIARFSVTGNTSTAAGNRDENLITNINTSRGINNELNFNLYDDTTFGFFFNQNVVDYQWKFYFFASDEIANLVPWTDEDFIDIESEVSSFIIETPVFGPNLNSWDWNGVTTPVPLAGNYLAVVTAEALDANGNVVAYDNDFAQFYVIPPFVAPPSTGFTRDTDLNAVVDFFSGNTQLQLGSSGSLLFDILQASSARIRLGASDDSNFITYIVPRGEYASEQWCETADYQTHATNPGNRVYHGSNLGNAAEQFTVFNWNMRNSTGNYSNAGNYWLAGVAVDQTNDTYDVDCVPLTISYDNNAVFRTLGSSRYSLADPDEIDLDSFNDDSIDLEFDVTARTLVSFEIKNPSGNRVYFDSEVYDAGRSTHEALLSEFSESLRPGTYDYTIDLTTSSSSGRTTTSGSIEVTEIVEPSIGAITATPSGTGLRLEFETNDYDAPGSEVEVLVNGNVIKTVPSSLVGTGSVGVTVISSELNQRMTNVRTNYNLSLRFVSDTGSVYTTSNALSVRKVLEYRLSRSSYDSEEQYGRLSTSATQLITYDLRVASLREGTSSSVCDSESQTCSVRLVLDAEQNSSVSGNTSSVYFPLPDNEDTISVTSDNGGNFTVSLLEDLAATVSNSETASWDFLTNDISRSTVEAADRIEIEIENFDGDKYIDAVYSVLDGGTKYVVQ